MQHGESKDNDCMPQDFGQCMHQCCAHLRERRDQEESACSAAHGFAGHGLIDGAQHMRAAQGHDVCMHHACLATPSR